MEKRSLSFISDFSETTKFLIILLATSTVLILLGLNQNQIAIAQQQQKLQGFQNNQTSSSSLTKQQQPIGISFQIDNMTFSHHTASVNGIQLRYAICETCFWSTTVFKSAEQYNTNNNGSDKGIFHTCPMCSSSNISLITIANGIFRK